MNTDEQKTTLIEAVNAASTKWKTAFNSKDAAGCAEQYEPKAFMNVRPLGTFTGTDEIQKFWEKLIGDGYSDVNYIDPKIEVIDETSAIITAGWKMNKAGGVIHKELWVLQEDGTVKLRVDDFEITG